MGDYKYFPMAFTTSFYGGFVCATQNQNITVGYAWLNNQDISLTRYRVGIGNDWTNGGIQTIYVLVLGV